MITILCFLFWIWCFFKCLNNDRLKGADKALWIVIILILPVIGSIIYFVTQELP